jgi:hypothetical protein
MKNRKKLDRHDCVKKRYLFSCNKKMIYNKGFYLFFEIQMAVKMGIWQLMLSTMQDALPQFCTIQRNRTTELKALQGLLLFDFLVHLIII